MSGVLQGQFLLIIFLSVGHTFPFLCMPCNILLKTGDFEYYHVATLNIRFYLLPMVCCYCLLWLWSFVCLEMFLYWDAWVAQSVKHPTSAQVMISQFVGLSPAWGSLLTAQSLDLLRILCLPLSLPLPAHFLSLSLKINK